MSSDTKLHLPTAFVLYFMLSVAFAFAGYSISQGHLPSLGSLEVGAAVLVAMGTAALFLGWLVRDHAVANLLRSAAVKMLAKCWHFVLAWVGAGMYSYAVACLAAGGQKIPFLPFCIIAGPLTALFVTNSWFVGVCLVGITGGFAAWLDTTKAAHAKGGTGGLTTAARGITKFMGFTKDFAAGEKPDAAAFVETIGPYESYVIEPRDRSQRVALGIGQLAPDWGKKKVPTELGLPAEGSGLMIGAPGSGKGLVFQRILLSAERCDPARRMLPTKFIVLSTKPRDLSGPTVRWLRSQGFDVKMWDLSGSTRGTSRYGDEMRWSPGDSATTYEGASNVALQLVESGLGASSSDPTTSYFKAQATIMLATAIYTNKIEGGPFSTALEWGQKWPAADFNDVDRVLFREAGKYSNDDPASKAKRDELNLALDNWQQVRQMLLEKKPPIDWTEPKGRGPSAGPTGTGISSTLSAVLFGLRNPDTFAATDNPNFSPREWIRTPGDAALFLVGNNNNKQMTRALLVTCVDELLHETEKYANEFDSTRVPMRVVCLFDELANLAPLRDLDYWFSTARSTGIQILPAFQSLGQIDDVYGSKVARTIRDDSRVTMVLSGISDPELIEQARKIGGSQYVELNKGTVTSQPLIEGHDFTSMQPPNPRTGAPGDALLIASGGVAKVKVPFWAMEDDLAVRGELPAHFEEATATMKKGSETWKTEVAQLAKKIYGTPRDAKP